MGEAARKIDPDEDPQKDGPDLELIGSEKDVMDSQAGGEYNPPDLRLVDDQDNIDTSAEGNPQDNAGTGSPRERYDADIYEDPKKDNDKKDEDKDKTEKGKEGKNDSDKGPEGSTSSRNTSSPSQSDKKGPVIDNFSTQSRTSQAEPGPNKLSAPPTDKKSEFQPGGGPAIKNNPGAKDLDKMSDTGKTAGGGGGVSKAKVVGSLAKGAKEGGIEGAVDAADDVAGTMAAKGAGKLARVAAVASGAGAFLSGLADKAATYLTKKLWPVFKKWIIPITAMNVIVALLIIGSLIGIVGIALKGGFGKQNAQPTSAYNSSDMLNLNTVLGAEIIGNASEYLFRQGDKRWGSTSYGCGGTTIKSGGCGCTSVAMVLKKYGASITPVEACAYSLKNGHRICGAGTSPSLFKPLAAEYGLKLSIVSWEEAKQLLAQGKPLIKNFGGEPFSSGGHYVVLVGIQGNTVYLNDPGPRGNKYVSVSDVLNKKRAGGFYYIHP